MRFYEDLGLSGDNMELRHFPDGKPVSLKEFPDDFTQYNDLYFTIGDGIKKGSFTKDDDITGKKYCVIDIDVRENVGGSVSDQEIEDCVGKLLELYDSHEKLKQWRYVVLSGNGLHIYYVADEMTATDPIEYRNAVQWLYEESDRVLPPHLVCDKSCKNISRIMRCPKTINSKRKEKYGLNDPFLVNNDWEQPNVTCDLFNDLGKYAKIIIDRETEKSRQNAEQYRKNIRDNDGSVFDMICDIDPIDFAEIVNKELGLAGYRVSGNYIHFKSPRDGKYSSLYIHRESGLLVSDGSKYIQSSERAFNPFSFINKAMNRTKSDTFQYYKDMYPHIADQDREEKKSVVEKPKQEKKEGKRESVLQLEPLDQKHPIKRLNPSEEAKLFLLEHSFAYYRGDIFIARDEEVIYGLLDEDILKKMIFTHLDNKYEKVSPKHIIDTLFFIKRQATDTQNKTKTLHEPDDNMIPLRNDIITIKKDGSWTTRPITKQDFISSTIDIDVDNVRNADRPDRWLDFLNWMCCAYTDKEAVIQTLQEYCGVCLIGGNIGEKALILVGGGGNGKGVFTKTIANILGQRSVGLTVTNRMAEDFSLPSLIGKTCAIDYDMGKVQLDDHLIKKLISGEQLNMNRKYKDRVPFSNKASLIMCTNKDPRVKDKDNSIKRRGIVMHCQGDLSNIEKIDRFDEVLYEMEGGAILKWMFDGLIRVIQRGAVEVSLELQESMQNFIDEQDHLLQYLLVQEESGSITHSGVSLKSTVSDDFNMRLKKSGHKQRTHQTIQKRMKEHYERFGIEEKQLRIRGRRLRILEGIDVGDLLHYTKDELSKTS